MKEYCLIYFLSLLLIFNLPTVLTTSELSKLKESSLNRMTSMKPEEIVAISKTTSPFNQKININYKETDPIKLMKIQV